MAHFAQSEAELDRRRQEAATLERNRRAQVWRAWEAQVLAELSGRGAPEGMVRILRLFNDDELRVRSWVPELGSAIRAAFPELWAGDLLETPGWNHDAIQAWFLDTVKSPPTVRKLEYLKTRPLRRDKWQRDDVLGWTLEAGSTQHLWGSDYHTIRLLIDGRRGHVTHADGGCSLSEPAPGFNVWALREMGSLAQLPDLPPRPTLASP